MKNKIVFLILLCFPLNAYGAANTKASRIRTDTTGFNRLLSTADTTVQKALDTLDNNTLPGSPLMGSTANGYTATFSIAPGSANSTTEAATRGWRAPQAGTLKNLYMRVNTAPDNGVGTQSWTCVATVNNVAATGTCTMSEATNTCNDGSNSDVVAAGDDVHVKCTAAGTPITTGGEGVSFTFLPS